MGIIIYTYNPSTPEAETSVWQVQGQPDLHKHIILRGKGYLHSALISLSIKQIIFTLC